MNNKQMGYPNRTELEKMALKTGFSAAGFLDLHEFNSYYREVHFTGHIDPQAAIETEKQGGMGVMITALPTPVNPEKHHSENPMGTIAPFAVRNYYQESVNKLKKISVELRKTTGFRKRDFRVFSNSRFPEKLMAAAAGLGFIGRNSLLITKVFGSQIVLSGLILPWFPDDPEKRSMAETVPGSGCGTCRECISACPTNALSGEGKVDTDKCLQALSTKLMRKEYYGSWETRIYGCQDCQDPCPFNRKFSYESDLSPGNPGPEVEIGFLLSPEIGSLKDFFKGTTLDQGWIEERFILRNALLAAGNHPDGVRLKNYVYNHTSSGDMLIREAAGWALKEIHLKEKQGKD